ncbi:MAG: 2,5-diamino-6-(ribosylamino)-4(3H)-pyrimidinone 5'-phosphate reductase [Candidatus Lokiarchaeota archaeon]
MNVNEERNFPYIILSAAMTIDGKIASKSGDPELSDEEDWREVHKLRTEVEAIMVGKGTIIKDNPKLHIKYYKHQGYYRIVMDSKLSIPIDSKVINYEPVLYPTLICCVETIDKKKESLFKKINITLIKAGSEERVDIRKALKKLYKMGIKSILLEGGGNLNWSFLKGDLIDEIRLTIAPWMVGGREAISLVEGEGYNKMNSAQRFNLIRIQNRNNYVILHYRRN